MSDFSEISKLLRQLADAFDNLGGRASSQGGTDGHITISGVTTKPALIKHFVNKKGESGFMARINVRMENKVNNSFYANCIAWVKGDDSRTYEFSEGDEVTFRGRYEKNDRGYYDFVISKDGNLYPKQRTSETPPDDDNEPF